MATIRSSSMLLAQARSCRLPFPWDVSVNIFMDFEKLYHDIVGESGGPGWKVSTSSALLRKPGGLVRVDILPRGSVPFPAHTVRSRASRAGVAVVSTWIDAGGTFVVRAAAFPGGRKTTSLWSDERFDGPGMATKAVEKWKAMDFESMSVLLAMRGD